MGKVISIGKNGYAIPEPQAPLNFKLQFSENGLYFGGIPDITYQIFTDFCNNGIPVYDSVDKFCKDNNSSIALQIVTVTQLQENIIPLLKSNQKTEEYDGEKILLTFTDITSESLQSLWADGIAKTRKSKSYYGKMTQMLADTAETKEHFIGTLRLALERDMIANGMIDDKFIGGLTDTLDNDINLIFLDNYADYIAHPEQTKRTFCYKGIHL